MYLFQSETKLFIQLYMEVVRDQSSISVVSEPQYKSTVHRQTTFFIYVEAEKLSMLFVCVNKTRHDYQLKIYGCFIKLLMMD